MLDLGRGVRKAAKDSLHAALKTMNQVPPPPRLHLLEEGKPARGQQSEARTWESDVVRRRLSPEPAHPTVGQLERAALSEARPCVLSLWGVCCGQADLGPSLQVFYNLQSLPPVIMDALNGVLIEAIDATKRAFDTQTLERSTSQPRRRSVLAM